MSSFYSDGKYTKGPVERRPLPKVDLSLCEDDPAWLNWKSGTPPIPDWYWVTRKGVWPQIVEFRMKGGQMCAMDRHSDGLPNQNFWTKYAGPIPGPNPIGAPSTRKRAKK